MEQQRRLSRLNQTSLADHKIHLRSICGNRDKGKKAVYPISVARLYEQHRPKFQQGTAQGIILGNDHFIDTVLNKTSQRLQRQVSLKDILNVVCDHCKCRQIDLSSKTKSRPIAEARAVAALMVQESEHHSPTQLSRELDRDLSTLSQPAARLEERMRKDSSLAEKLADLKKKLE